MAFLSDIFNRAGRVARGQANEGMSAVEDATFDATVRQTVADMRNELNKAVQASAVAMSNYNRLDSEYQKYVRQSQEWKMCIRDRITTGCGPVAILDGASAFTCKGLTKSINAG